MSSKIGISADEITAAIKALPPVLEAPRIHDTLDAAMAAMHARPKSATQTRVILYRFDDGPTASADSFQAAMQAGNLPIHDVCGELDCDLQLIELGSGTADAQDNARACAFGMMAAEQATGLIVAASFGAGSDVRAQHIAPEKFFETATPEAAALLGAMVAGIRAGIPVIAEGAQGLAALRALKHLRSDLGDGVFICGVSENDPALHIFADTEKSDTGYAAVMLAALIQSEFVKYENAA